jgi:hypothetical protein
MTMRSVVTAAGAIAAILVSALTAGPAMAGGNCLDRLNGNSYSCLFIDSVQQTVFPSQLSFEEGVLDQDGREYICSCEVAGNFNNPRFDASKTEWTCVRGAIVLGEPVGVAIRGRVGGNGKISQVTSANTGGVTSIFSCDLD